MHTLSENERTGCGPDEAQTMSESWCFLLRKTVRTGPVNMVALEALEGAVQFVTRRG